MCLLSNQLWQSLYKSTVLPSQFLVDHARIREILNVRYIKVQEVLAARKARIQAAFDLHEVVVAEAFREREALRKATYDWAPVPLLAGDVPCLTRGAARMVAAVVGWVEPSRIHAQCRLRGVHWTGQIGKPRIGPRKAEKPLHFAPMVWPPISVRPRVDDGTHGPTFATRR